MNRGHIAVAGLAANLCVGILGGDWGLPDFPSRPQLGREGHGNKV